LARGQVYLLNKDDGICLMDTARRWFFRYDFKRLSISNPNPRIDWQPQILLNMKNTYMVRVLLLWIDEKKSGKKGEKR